MRAKCKIPQFRVGYVVSKLKGSDSTWWDRTSRRYRQLHPLCERCLALGRVAAAYDVEHIIPHRGDRRLLMNHSNLQSLCERCHNAVKQGIESRGYDTAIGADGFPIDSNHPFNVNSK